MISGGGTLRLPAAASASAIIGILFSLTGCLQVPDPHRFDGQRAAIKAECASQPTHLARERCANPRLAAINVSLGLPSDIITAYFARREAVAERMDSGAITETEGAAEMAEATERANTAAHLRQPAPVVCTTTAGVTVCN
jgi:hypothetical protein